MLKFSTHKDSLAHIEADITLVFIIDKNFKHKWIDKSFLESLAYKADTPLLHQETKHFISQ